MGDPSKPTPAELLDLLVSRASAMRDAGILNIELDGLSATLAPKEVPLELGKSEDEPAPSDALDDPTTFGLPRGAQLPRRSHLITNEDPS